MDHPDSIARWARARAEGASVDAGYSRREYALTLSTPRGIVTLNGCRFDDPARVIARASIIDTREVA